MKVVSSLSLAIAAIAGICVTLSAAAQDNILTGAGGASVFSKIYTEYGQAHDVKVEYQPIGAGGGILQLTDKKVDFAEITKWNSPEIKATNPKVILPTGNGLHKDEFY